MSEVKVIVGGTIEDDAADLLDAWHRTEQGEHVAAERVLAFESWEGLSEGPDRRAFSAAAACA